VGQFRLTEPADSFKWKSGVDLLINKRHACAHQPLTPPGQWRLKSPLSARFPLTASSGKVFRTVTSVVFACGWCGWRVVV
jgi:hypothetical protein